MNKSIYRKTLDVQKQGIQFTVNAAKNEALSRQIVLTIVDGGKPFDFDSENLQAVLYAIKPDGNILYNDCVRNGNTLIYTFTQQTLTAAGDVVARIKITASDDDTQVLYAPQFIIQVEDVSEFDNAVVSTNEYSALVSAVSDMEKTKNDTNITNEKLNKYLQELKTDKEAGAFNGEDGYTPVKGIDYFDGADGRDGYTPQKGIDYFDGKSAYEIAVETGFEGTEKEWLESLKGDSVFAPLEYPKGTVVNAEDIPKGIYRVVNSLDVRNAITLKENDLIMATGYADFGAITEGSVYQYFNGQGIFLEENLERLIQLEKKSESLDNKTDVISEASTEVQYPTAKSVYEFGQSINEAFNNALENKANTSDIPSLEGYATEEWVSNQTQPKEEWMPLVDLITTADDQHRLSGNNFPYLFFAFDAAYSNVFIDVQFPQTMATTVVPYFSINGTTASPSGQNVLGFQANNFNTLRGTIEQLPNKYFKSQFVAQNVTFGQNDNNQEHYTGNVFTSINANKYVIKNKGFATLCFFLRNDMDIPIGTKVKIWGVIK